MIPSVTWLPVRDARERRAGHDVHVVRRVDANLELHSMVVSSSKSSQKSAF
jgi:hypothetical protein